jgi:hypothetical protein
MRKIGNKYVRSSSRKIGEALALACAVFLICATVFSQANTGRILGNVNDQTGGAIAGATVTVTDTERGTTRTLTSDDSGSYSAPSLIPGTYTVRAEFKGFKSTERQNIVLEVGKEARVDLELQPGEQTEKITVTEALPLVETTNAVLGGTLQPGTIADLPLNGRNFMNLLQLRPGVTVYLGGGAWTQSTNGLRPQHNVYMLDGITGMEPLGSQSTFNGVSLAGDASTLVPIDTIQEFNVQQNPKAEFGWKPGSITNVALKSGTNAIHGTANAFGRTDALDARNPFLTGTNPDGTAQKQRIGLQEWGATLGGPIKKDKAFFFLGYESQRYHVGNPNTFTFPTLAAGQGISNSVVDACNSVKGLAALSPTSLKVSGLDSNCSPVSGAYSIFNLDQDFARDAGGNGINVTASLDTQYSVDNGLGKVDLNINDKNTINGKYFVGTHRGLVVNSATITQPYWRPHDQAWSYFVGAQWNHTPSSAVVNTFRFGFNDFYQWFENSDCPGQGNGAPDSFGVPFGYGANIPTCGFTGITLQGFTGGIGCCGSFPKYYGPDHIYEFIDHLSILKGKHSLKFGGEFRNIGALNTGTYGRTRGVTAFTPVSGLTTLQAFMEGVPGANGSITIGNPRRRLTGQAYALFFQDDYRITQKLMLNLGVRWEMSSPMKEKFGRIANWDPANGFQQLGIQTNQMWNEDKNNFAPRLGLAYDIRGNGKTVLRAGGNIIYVNPGWWMQVFQQNANNPTQGLVANPSGFLICNGSVNVSSSNTAPGPTCQQGPGTIKNSGLTLTPAQTNWNQAPGLYAGAIYPSSTDTSNLRCGTDKLCGIQATDTNYRNAYVSSWSFGVQQAFTNNLSLSVDYVGNHATKLIGMYYTNTPLPGAGFCLNPNGSAFSAAQVAAVAAQASLSGGSGACPTLPTTISAATTMPSTNANAIQASRPYNAQYPYLGYIYTVSNPFMSNYNGMQLTLTQRPVHGLGYTLGFTFAHALDEAGDENGGPSGQNPNDFRAEYSNSGFDIRKRFTGTVTYALPGIKGFARMLEGWKLTSIVTLQSALPWSQSSQSGGGNDIAGIGEFVNNWNFYGNPQDFSDRGTNPVPCFSNGVGSGGQLGCTPSLPQACIDQANSFGPLGRATLNKFGCLMQGSSFMIPAPIGQFGNVKRYMFRGNPFKIWDASVLKDWKLTERLAGEFRFEVFNVLNTTHFGNPTFNGGGVTNPFATLNAFGSTQATPDVANNNPSLGSGGPREFQLGFKLTF